MFKFRTREEQWRAKQQSDKDFRRKSYHIPEMSLEAKRRRVEKLCAQCKNQQKMDVSISISVDSFWSTECLVYEESISKGHCGFFLTGEEIQIMNKSW